ncbi:MAG: type 4a pilus biogenesis protein PilO [Actinomycetota bacterium]|nr:type 4a pilus biogenesis protein PilO [Actinomycetota bacterium]
MNSARARLILAIVAALLVSVAFYFLFVRSRQGQLSEVQNEIDAEEAKTVELEATLSRLQGLQANAAKFEARLAEIRELIPPDDEVANFIFQVQDEANRAGVTFVEVTPEVPKPPPEGAQVAEIRAVIGAEGDYFALQDFLRRLYDLDRALRIDNLAITSEEDAETEQLNVTLTATARIFFELPAGGAAAAPGTTPAPAPTQPAPVPTVAPQG